MSNKTLEQAIEEQSRKVVDRNFYDLQEADARERHFKMGAIWLSQNLHLLSPSDVAKIECVGELIDALKLADGEIKCLYEIMNGKKPNVLNYFILKLNAEVLSNFEPKNEGVE